MRRIEYLREASGELEEATTWYLQIDLDLARRFHDTVRQLLIRIQTFPDAFPSYGAELRKALLPGFPYAVFYRVDIDRILIVAVAHLRRRPGYWDRRF